MDEQGRYSGVGKLTALNGDTYVGDFKAGTFHGKGCYTFRSGGGSYTGEFREGLFAGQGKEIYPDGSIYVGGFDNSKRSGVGSMHYSNGAVFTGVWKAGKKEGRGSFKYSDGTRFDGKFADGKREGIGFIYDKKGRKLQGKWKEGKLLNGGKLTRVLHKEKVSAAPAAGSENSGEEDAHGAEGGGGTLMVSAAVHAGAAAGADSDELTESKDSIDGELGSSTHQLTAQSAHSTPATKLRQRIPQQASSMSALSSPVNASASSSSAVTRKPLSASREKELTNNLLNFSKKQQGIMSLARSAESAREARQARERAELIKQLAGAAHKGRGSGLSTTESSSSSSSSTSHSSAASTTTQSPMLQPSSKQQHRYDSVLAPLAGIGGGGESSGVDSELAGTADDADADDATHGAAASSGGRASSEVHEWLASKEDPTHVSNSHSLAATPLLSNGSLLSSPRSTPLSRQSSKTLSGNSGVKQPRHYLSSGSEREGEALSPRSSAAARIHSNGGGSGVDQAASAAAVSAASAASSLVASLSADPDASSADESAAADSKPNGSPAKTKHPVVLTAR